MYHICHIYYIYHIHHRVDLPLALVAHTHTCQADEYRVDTPAAHGSPAPPADPHIPPMLMDVDSLGTFREDKGGYAYLSVVCVCVCACVRLPLVVHACDLQGHSPTASLHDRRASRIGVAVTM